ncbi:MAG: hypothetical protein A2744_03720 [Candidatus Buchananbacteria bacterium RIFCSPHIGHO2_01_FULL_44_11]|uniref:Cation-transporting P-type ATPase N-terminal domain-containing protein n=3 Tax=Candidatus Buchananiibacteriota TaxID=1817903 RepID=A0A1G1Y4L7_9BACT|nr:MAG: hypothetical protein A2744_03720 [Candidatus Buchananbacteria bacterium RIFCSPHIGHO2_01_FULL_44_11]
MEEKLWHALLLSDVYKKLDSSAKGLSGKEAEQRVKHYGKNELPAEKSLSGFAILLSQLKSPLAYILFGAALISALLADFSDALIILVAMVINVVLGYYQEYKANRAITHLKKLVDLKAKVLRNGRAVSLSSRELVPGDIIFLSPGDKVPADARLIKVDNLQVIEAALTGESMPSTKIMAPMKRGVGLADRENIVYAGTVVARGTALAVVFSTGIKTEIGQITKLIAETKEEPTPLQRQIGQLGKILTYLVIAASVLIVIIGGLGGRPIIGFGEGAKESILLLAVAVAVSAIPEGLLIAVTVILSIGMQMILKQKALIRRLVAAETLGSTSIICTDKTGTLTEGRMRVERIITFAEELVIEHPGNYQKSETLKDHDLITKISLLCGNATIENPESELEEIKVIGDSTEQALTIAAWQQGITKEKLEKDQPRLLEIPFDSETKFMATFNHLDRLHNVVYVKGAPEKILAMSNYLRHLGKKEPLTAVKRRALVARYEQLTTRGLRLLAFAYKKVDQNKPVTVLEAELNDLVFIGFVALKDPLRQEAKETFQLARQAGIRSIVVTGDHKLTAKAIVAELGLKVKEANILEGKDLDAMSDEEFQSVVKNIDIYARVEPRHKIRIVVAWQKEGEVVAMTGDGVNDAPALKAADIGVALGSGTDVAKETADMILLDDNFKTIVAAIKRGRVIFDNIRKVVMYLLSDSLSEVVLVIGSLLLKLPLPVLPAQILWVNIIDDSFPALALTVEEAEGDVMSQKPRPKKESIINRQVKIIILSISIVMNVLLLSLFYILLQLGYELDHARTFIFAGLGLDSLVFAFSARSLRHSTFSKNPFSNRYLTLGVIAGVLLQILAIYHPSLQRFFDAVPLTIQDWGLLAALGFVQLIIVEIIKQTFIVKKYV